MYSKHNGKALHGHHRSQWSHQEQKIDLAFGHIWLERGTTEGREVSHFLVLKGEKRQSWTGPTGIEGSNPCITTVEQNTLPKSHLITTHLSHPAVTWR